MDSRVLICIFVLATCCSAARLVRQTKELKEPVCEEQMRIGCPRIYAPVCGNDSKTYSNLCTMCDASYTQSAQGKPNITYQHSGECNPSEQPLNTEADFRSQMPHCAQFVGTRACNKMYMPLCGSDDETYSNKCEMCRITGEQRKLVSVKHEGSCAGKMA